MAFITNILFLPLVTMVCFAIYKASIIVFLICFDFWGHLQISIPLSGPHFVIPCHISTTPQKVAVSCTHVRLITCVLINSM